MRILYDKSRDLYLQDVARRANESLPEGEKISLAQVAAVLDAAQQSVEPTPLRSRPPKHLAIRRGGG